MVIKKKKLFYDIGIRYVWILCIYVVMSISLNEIVVRGNDYIAQVTDSMLTGKPVVLQNILIQMSGMIIVGTVAAYFADLSRKYYSSLVQREVRGRLAEHLLHLPYSYFDEKGSGSILTRFSSDIGEAGNFFSDILPDLLVDIVTVGTITAYFIQMDVRLIVILFASYPVMLLDDVLSELDPRRQEYVLNRIAGGQVFITCCENDRLDALLSGRVYHVREGKVL